MKLIFKYALIIAGLSAFSYNANAQWYSYDKAENTTDPEIIIKLINNLKPAILIVPISSNTKKKNEDFQDYLKTNKVQLAALYSALKRKPHLTDNEKAALYFLRRQHFGFIFFPVRNVAQAKAYYENSGSFESTDEEGLFKLEHAYLNYLTQSKKLAAYSEIAHDYIGPVRLSLGLLGLVPSSKDSAVTTKKSDSLYNMKLFQDRFKSSGGIAQLNISFPLLHLHDNNSRYFDLKAYASPRFAADVPKEDTNVQRFAHHTQLGGEVQLKVTTFEKAFTFLLCWRGFQAWGNSTFYDNMGFTGTDRRSFNFNTWTAGVIVKDKLQFYYTWYGGSSRAINQVPQKNNNSLTANYQF